MTPTNAKRLWCLLIPICLLTACGTEVSSQVLPDVVVYGRAFQTQAAGEVVAMKPPCARDIGLADANCSAVQRMLIDFKHMRDQARAIAKK